MGPLPEMPGGFANHAQPCVISKTPGELTDCENATLQDCIDFDELMNDFHSTAASAQLLQQTLSGSLGPTPSGGDDGPNILALVPDT